jgi:hypothetical protein
MITDQQPNPWRTRAQFYNLARHASPDRTRRVARGLTFQHPARAASRSWRKSNPTKPFSPETGCRCHFRQCQRISGSIVGASAGRISASVTATGQDWCQRETSPRENAQRTRLHRGTESLESKARNSAHLAKAKNCSHSNLRQDSSPCVFPKPSLTPTASRSWLWQRRAMSGRASRIAAGLRQNPPEARSR